MNSSTFQPFSTFRKTLARIRGLQILAPRQTERPNQYNVSQARPLQLELDFREKKMTVLSDEQSKGEPSRLNHNFRAPDNEYLMQ